MERASSVENNLKPKPNLKTKVAIASGSRAKKEATIEKTAGRPTRGTRIAAANRAKMNRLGDAERRTLLHRGTELISRKGNER